MTVGCLITPKYHKPSNGKMPPVYRVLHVYPDGTLSVERIDTDRQRTISRPEYYQVVKEGDTP